MATNSGKAARSVHPLLRAYAGELNARMGRGVKTRLWGLAVVAGAGGLVTVGGGVPMPQPAAYALGLISLAMACLGVLFLIHGASLRDQWRTGVLAREAPAVSSPSDTAHSANDLSDCRWASVWALGGRPSLAAHLILCASRDASRSPSRYPRRRDETGKRS